MKIRLKSAILVFQFKNEFFYWITQPIISTILATQYFTYMGTYTSYICHSLERKSNVVVSQTGTIMKTSEEKERKKVYILFLRKEI